VHQDGQRINPMSRPSAWAHRALDVGGRALGSAGHALSSAEHLATEALVAFVDGELGLGAHQRAAAHLARCAECSAEVRAQLQARAAVRASLTPCTPIGLLGALRRIPDGAAAMPGPGTRSGGSVVQDAAGAWVSVLRPQEYRPAPMTPESHRR